MYESNGERRARPRQVDSNAVALVVQPLRLSGVPDSSVYGEEGARDKGWPPEAWEAVDFCPGWHALRLFGVQGASWLSTALTPILGILESLGQIGASRQTLANLVGRALEWPGEPAILSQLFCRSVPSRHDDAEEHGHNETSP